jgi:hypothetical protein
MLTKKAIIRHVDQLKHVSNLCRSLTLTNFFGFKKQAFEKINKFMITHSDLQILRIINISISGTNSILFKIFLDHISKFSLITLEFTNISFNTNTFQMFLSFIKNMDTVKNLILNNNRIDDIMFEKLVYNTKHITRLNLEINCIKILFEFNEHLNIKYLNVRQNLISNVPKCWCDQLTHLNLMNNYYLETIECYESFFSLIDYQFTGYNTSKIDSILYLQNLLDFLQSPDLSQKNTTSIIFPSFSMEYSQKYNELALQIINLLPNLPQITNVNFNNCLTEELEIIVLNTYPNTNIQEINVHDFCCIETTKIFDIIIKSPNLKSIKISYNELLTLITSNPEVITDQVASLKHNYSIINYKFTGYLGNYTHDEYMLKFKCFTDIIDRNYHNMVLKQMSLIYL